MRISTPMFYKLSIDQMQAQQSKLSHTQQQVASGLRVLTPTDDPAAATRILDLGSEIETYSQYMRNMDHAESRLEMSESAMGAMTSHLQRIRELAIRGLNDSLSASDRNAISFEIEALMNQLLAIANTRDASGEFIFAGYQSDSRPFDHDGVGNFTYNGDSGERELRINASSYLKISESGDKVFMNIAAAGGGTQNMFASIHGLVQDLRADNPNPASLENIDNALDNLLTLRAELGARLNVIDTQRSVNESVTLQLQTSLSSEQDLDYAEAISRLNQQVVALQASQQAFIKVQGLSLFNYL